MADSTRDMIKIWIRKDSFKACFLRGSCSEGDVGDLENMNVNVRLHIEVSFKMRAALSSLL